MRPARGPVPWPAERMPARFGLEGQAEGRLLVSGPVVVWLRKGGKEDLPKDG
jgi:hypothetical protein